MQRAEPDHALGFLTVYADSFETTTGHGLAMGLEIVELMMDIERAYGITIPDDAMDNIHTLGDFHDLIAKLVAEQKPERFAQASFHAELWPAIAHYATRNGYHSEPDTVTRQTRFVEDLGYG